MPSFDCACFSLNTLLLAPISLLRPLSQSLFNPNTHTLKTYQDIFIRVIFDVDPELRDAGDAIYLGSLPGVCKADDVCEAVLAEEFGGLGDGYASGCEKGVGCESGQDRGGCTPRYISPGWRGLGLGWLACWI